MTKRKSILQTFHVKKNTTKISFEEYDKTPRCHQKIKLITKFIIVFSHELIIELFETIHNLRPFSFGRQDLRFGATLTNFIGDLIIFFINLPKKFVWI